MPDRTPIRIVVSMTLTLRQRLTLLLYGRMVCVVEGDSEHDPGLLDVTSETSILVKPFPWKRWRKP